MSFPWSLKEKIQLTDEQRQIYAAERLDNFRWIFQLLASSSPRTLTSADLVPENIREELDDIGQFAEIVYSSVPLEVLMAHIDALSPTGYPLEGYTALRDAVLDESFLGSVAKLPTAIFRRPARNHLIIAFCGTTQLQHVVQDLHFVKRPHPAGAGSVHSGFWGLYTGIADRVKAAVAAHPAADVVVTGHSMGGAVAYLLALDLLSELAVTRKLTLATFGAPRVGDAPLVAHFRRLADKRAAFTELAVRSYNDGVPTLPPMRLGYRHFARRPLYTPGGALYQVPEEESESTLFRCTVGAGEAPPRFPRGGHNYYSGRELERLLRRLTWLEKARIPQEGWEGRYEALAGKSLNL